LPVGRPLLEGCAVGILETPDLVDALAELQAKGIATVRACAECGGALQTGSLPRHEGRKYPSDRHPREEQQWRAAPAPRRLESGHHGAEVAWQSARRALYDREGTDWTAHLGNVGESHFFMTAFHVTHTDAGLELRPGPHNALWYLG
jgi:hypothetical protein